MIALLAFALGITSLIASAASKGGNKKDKVAKDYVIPLLETTTSKFNAMYNLWVDNQETDTTTPFSQKYLPSGRVRSYKCKEDRGSQEAAIRGHTSGILYTYDVTCTYKYGDEFHTHEGWSV